MGMIMQVYFQSTQLLLNYISLLKQYFSLVVN